MSTLKENSFKLDSPALSFALYFLNHLEIKLFNSSEEKEEDINSYTISKIYHCKEAMGLQHEFVIVQLIQAVGNKIPLHFKVERSATTPSDNLLVNGKQFSTIIAECAYSQSVKDIRRKAVNYLAFNPPNQIRAPEIIE